MLLLVQEFSDKMKITKVRPVFKNGERHNVQNYRQKSILPVFDKILEKLKYNRLISFVNKYNILPKAQNGFRKMKSTGTANETFIESNQEATDKCKHVVGIFLDLTKA
jgi:Reverse transcriptase (RNA-dependent DNA polymerase).